MIRKRVFYDIVEGSLLLYASIKGGINMYPYDQHNMPPGFLPAQQVIQVDGRQSALNIKMAPNSSTIVADKNLPMIYMCMTDGLGNVTVTPYDITPHQDPPPIDMNSIEVRLSEIERIVKNLEEKRNGKPHDAKSSDKQDGAD